MDWSRAKTILIISFIFLDLFLAYKLYLIVEQKSYTQTHTIDSQQIDQLLESNKIKLASRPIIPTNVSTYVANITPLSSDWSRDERGGYIQTPSPSPTFKTTRSVEKYLATQFPTFFKEYTLSDVDSIPSTKWVFFQMHNGKKIFDGRVEVTIDEQNITTIRVVHYHIMQTLPSKLTDFNAVLYRLITDDVIVKYSTISQIDLGYRAKSDPSASENFILVPYWRLHVGNRLLYVNATDPNENVE